VKIVSGLFTSRQLLGQVDLYGVTEMLNPLISKRTLMLVKKCLTSSSDILQYVACYGVYHGHMASVFGGNVVFDSKQFSLSVADVIYGQIDLGCSRSESLSTYRAASLFEFLMFRHGI